MQDNSGKSIPDEGVWDGPGKSIPDVGVWDDPAPVEDVPCTSDTTVTVENVNGDKGSTSVKLSTREFGVDAGTR